MKYDEAVKYLPKLKEFLVIERMIHSDNEEALALVEESVECVNALIEFHKVPRPMSAERALRIVR